MISKEIREAAARESRAESGSWNASTVVAECKRAVTAKAAGLAGSDDAGAAKVEINAEIDRLAVLDQIAYDNERDAVAERFGCRISTLDKEVAKRREAVAGTKSADLCADVEPCAEPVEAAELLEAIRATIGRFIVCDGSTATAATLWVAFTWIIEHAQVAPLAIITAPEKGCGKTQLLDVIGRLSRRALFASNITPAATFRVLEARSPTLLIDEADAFMRENEELRGVINSGHTRTSAYVIRTVGDDFAVKQFSTWGAKAIAGIGRLPETVMSRGVILNLRRKLKSEKVERLRHAEPGLFDALAAQLARFGQDYGETIARARPHLPDALADRAQDNWEHLLAIADFAGGAWPKEARRAALAISGAESDAVSTSEELLADIRDIFDADGATRFSMAELLRRLLDDETAPWASWNRGRPMTARQLGARLKEFGVHAVTVHLGQYEKPKGFKREQFEDAWGRYLDAGPLTEDAGHSSQAAPLPPVTRSPVKESGVFTVTREVTEENSVGHPGVWSPNEREVTEEAIERRGDRTQFHRSPLRSPEKPIFSGQGDRVTDQAPSLAKDIQSPEIEVEL